MKTYGHGKDDQGTSRRYSPPVCTGATKVWRMGAPRMDKVSTAYVERLNLNTRQNCRRFTRLTNAFSKSARNHVYAVGLNFMAHNFIKPHGTLSKAFGMKTTPAMASGLTDRVWGWEDVLARMDPSFLLH